MEVGSSTLTGRTTGMVHASTMNIVFSGSLVSTFSKWSLQILRRRHVREGAARCHTRLRVWDGRGLFFHQIMTTIQERDVSEYQVESHFSLDLVTTQSFNLSLVTLRSEPWWFVVFIHFTLVSVVSVNLSGRIWQSTGVSILHVKVTTPPFVSSLLLSKETH